MAHHHLDHLAEYISLFMVRTNPPSLEFAVRISHPYNSCSLSCRASSSQGCSSGWSWSARGVILLIPIDLISPYVGFPAWSSLSLDGWRSSTSSPIQGSFCTFENIAFTDWQVGILTSRGRVMVCIYRCQISAGGRGSWRRTSWVWRWSWRLATTHTRSYSLSINSQDLNHHHDQALKFWEKVAAIHPEGPSFLWHHPHPHYR